MAKAFKWKTQARGWARKLSQAYSYKAEVQKFTEMAQEIEEWMRANATWKDRTGEARRTLKAEIVRTGDVYSLKITHGVEYGYHLETMQAGRFSIIAPTLDYWANRIYGRLR